MDIVLHVGAHRTGNQTLHRHLAQNSDVLKAAGVDYWGAGRALDKVFHGLSPTTHAMHPRRSPQTRAAGRVSLRVAQARHAGKSAVFASAPDMIGPLADCVETGLLYPAVGERMARVAQAFGAETLRIVLVVRGQDRFWSSVLAAHVMHGARVPDAQKTDRIAQASRSWRDVVTDLACAVPSADLRVLPFESFYAVPHVLTDVAGLGVSLRGQADWLGRRPDLAEMQSMVSDAALQGSDALWEPFAPGQLQHMREQYADDIFWLMEGADGLASLAEEAMPRGRGKARHAAVTRGHEHDEEGRMGEAG